MSLRRVPLPAFGADLALADVRTFVASTISLAAANEEALHANRVLVRKLDAVLIEVRTEKGYFSAHANAVSDRSSNSTGLKTGLTLSTRFSLRLRSTLRNAETPSTSSKRWARKCTFTGTLASR